MRKTNNNKQLKKEKEKKLKTKNNKVKKRKINKTKNNNSLNKNNKIILIITALLLVLCGLFLAGEYYNGKSKIIVQRQLTGSNNVEKAWNFYITEGFSKEATAGILGNYMRESKMDPTIEEKGNNIGFGLAQWSFSRRTELEKWTKENDFSQSSLEGQLNFSLIEMEKMKFGKYKYNDFKKVKDVKEATTLFEKYYERAGVVALEERIKYAEEIYRKYS